MSLQFVIQWCIKHFLLCKRYISYYIWDTGRGKIVIIHWEKTVSANNVIMGKLIPWENWNRYLIAYMSVKSNRLLFFFQLITVIYSLCSVFCFKVSNNIILFSQITHSLIHPCEQN